MSPKAAPKAAPKSAKKAEAKSPTKTAKAPKGGDKAGKVNPETAVQAAPVGEDGEEIDEDAATASQSSAGGGGNAAAMAAAAGGSTEMSASFKNFRHHPDMENFYRFIYENDLRYEAMAIIDRIMVEKQARKLAKQAKTHAH